MATTANYTSIPARAAGTPSVFRRAMARMVSAREKQVNRYVNGYLLSMDDTTLANNGFDRKELEKNGTAIYPF
ncbi:MAG: hypothetical protein COA52_04350 [Hyphomicrobiales bacterium]|nr:MAG: hypothetical protein COA52_04350 [Hyphomicrobiales bacterium]